MSYLSGQVICNLENFQPFCVLDPFDSRSNSNHPKLFTHFLVVGTGEIYVGHVRCKDDIETELAIARKLIEDEKIAPGIARGLTGCLRRLDVQLDNEWSCEQA